MNGVGFHRRPRSIGAQADRMRNKWPSFRLDRRPQFVAWTGRLTPIQKPYTVRIFWIPQSTEKPYVVLVDPVLRPRADGDYARIPHLLFFDDTPELSGLCLFDPDGKEWSNKRLIADTTVPWAAEWLYHYEFWLEDGVWRGASVGFESVAEARAAALYRQACQLADDTPSEAGMAQGQAL